MSFLIKTDDGARIVPCESLQIEKIQGKVKFDISQKQEKKYRELAYKYVSKFYEDLDEELIQEFVNFQSYVNFYKYEVEPAEFVITNEKGDVLASYSRCEYAMISLQKFCEWRNKFGESCVFIFLPENLFEENCEIFGEEEDEDYENEFEWLMQEEKDEVQ